MNRLVIDASVTVKWFLQNTADERDVEVALGLLEAGKSGDCSFVQPPHWVGEVAGVLVRHQPAVAASNIDDLLQFRIYSVNGTAAVYKRAIELSRRLEHHLFDTFYHAVALELGIQLITADRQYFNKAKKLGSIVMLDSLVSN